MRQLSILTTVILATTSVAFGAVIIEHIGANDPTTEGWTLTDESGGQNIYGPVFNDLGGIDAWRIDTITNAVDGDLLYRRALSDTEMNDAATAGWALTAVVRLVQADERGLTLRFWNNTTIYDLYMWGPADGDPRLTLYGDDRGLLLQGGNGAYHMLRMVDADADGLADVFIDGQLSFPGYSGMSVAGSDNEVQWGDYYAHKQNGHALYAQVTFEILPEPSTVTLFLSTTFLVVRRRRRT